MLYPFQERVKPFLVDNNSCFRGKRVSKNGSRWALTILEVSEPDEKGKIKSLYVDIQVYIINSIRFTHVPIRPVCLSIKDSAYCNLGM